MNIKCQELSSLKTLFSNFDQILIYIIKDDILIIATLGYNVQDPKDLRYVRDTKFIKLMHRHCNWRTYQLMWDSSQMWEMRKNVEEWCCWTQTESTTERITRLWRRVRGWKSQTKTSYLSIPYHINSMIINHADISTDSFLKSYSCYVSLGRTSFLLYKYELGSQAKDDVIS